MEIIRHSDDYIAMDLLQFEQARFLTNYITIKTVFLILFLILGSDGL